MSVACALAVVTGVAAIVDPALAALTLVLVALGVAAFLLGIRPRHQGRLKVGSSTFAAVSILAIGMSMFFVSPPLVTPLDPLLLALSTVPLWWVHRTETPHLKGGAAG